MSVPDSPLSDALAGPFIVAAGLLALSGLAKLYRPGPAVRAIEAVGLPGGTAVVRLVGSVELLVGLACLGRPDPIAAGSLAACYLAFTVFLLRLVRVSKGESCGCVGERNTPPSPFHVGLNLFAAAAGVGAALAPPSSPVELAWQSPMLGLPLIAGLLAAAYAAYAAVVYVPLAWRAYRPHADHGGSDGANVFRLEPFRPRSGATA
jgi:hypothetical protein